MTAQLRKLKPWLLSAAALLCSTSLGISQPEASVDIYIINFDTKELRRVSTLPNTDEGSPSWSPDGTKIVHEIRKEGVIVDARIFITNVETGRSAPLLGVGRGEGPAWSPDGRWIAFDKRDGIYIIPATGGTPEFVRAGAFGADWSPDSQGLVFIDEDSENVITINLNDSTETIVVGDESAVPEFENLMASWSPDGQWITFTIYDNGIWKIALDELGQPIGDPVQLTNGLEDDQVSWSSDSQTLVFESKRDGDFDLWTIPAAGGTATKLTPPNNMDETGPRFARNSNLVAYSAVTPPSANFMKITQGQIVTDVEFSLGSNWMDYNHDGYLDVFVANLNNNNYLYQNNGNGSFTRITTGIIDLDVGGSHSSTWGDYDNDGDLDVFIANLSPNFLYQNNGDGSFIKITSGAIVEDEGASMAASWGDFDNDGDLDLFVANRDNQNNFLYQNNGDGAFTKMNQGDIVNDGGASFGCAWGDYDHDGDLDLFVANGGFVGKQDNFLYENNGDATFTKIITGNVVNDAGNSFGGSWGDIDNDGDLDLYVTNANDQKNFLYRNRGDGTFIKIIGAGIVDDLGNSSSSSWGDFDNDGDIDLFVSNRGGQNNFLYENKGHGIFNRVTNGSLINTGGDSHGSSWGDYDKDGDLDLFVANSNDQANFLFENHSHGFNWINIKCMGTVSNASAIGARVSVKATIFSEPLWQRQEISGQTGGGFGGQNSLNAEFGLGDATIIDSIRIEWPSGTVQDTANVKVNQFLIIVEDSKPDLESPTINAINTLSIIDFGMPIEVSATVTDNGTVQEVGLFYRAGGEGVFQTTSMAEVDGSYQGTIPASVVGSRGVEFKIEVTDESNNLGASELQAVRVRVPDNQLSKIHQGGSAAQSYRLISIPLETDDPSVAATLLDDLGAADSLQWRLWDIDPQRKDSIFPYREFPAVSSMAAGKAKFLITRETVSLTSEAGVTVNTVQPFQIALTPGWNMIASPFNFDIPIANVQPESLRVHLNTYNGSWSSFPTLLGPWQGYMIKVNEPGTLTINPTQPAANPLNVIAKAGHHRQSEIPNPKSAIAAKWFIQIEAESGLAVDRDNIAGVIRDAAPEWDRYERFEPPPIGEFVMVSFPHGNWEKYPDIHTTDFHPPAAEGHIWDFTVSTNIPDKPVELTFAHLELVRPEFAIKLIDLSLNLTQDLRFDEQYIYRSQHYGGSKKFRIVVGNSDFVGENSAGFAGVPSMFELAQNFPNPFNPSTSIKFGLPQASQVTLKMFNLLGQEIVTLLDGIEKQAGHSVVIWDGKDQHGRRAPSGIYIYRLYAGSVVLSRKLTLLK
ncbi:MAG: FG-GAP-like repeat-containing protein [bacterium]